MLREDLTEFSTNKFKEFITEIIRSMIFFQMIISRAAKKCFEAPIGTNIANSQLFTTHW